MSNHFQNLKQYVPDLETRRILELGCGRGGFLLEAAIEGAKITGVDINEEYLQESKKKLEESGLSVDLLNIAGEKLPFDEISFDFVNMAEVLEHVENPKKVIGEVYRVLSTKGQVYLSVPARYSVWDTHYHMLFINWMPRRLSEKVIFFLGKHKDYKNSMSGRQRLSDMHYYTYNSIVDLLKNSGFEVDDIRVLKLKRMFGGFLGYIVLNLYKLVRNFYPETFHLLLKKT